MTIPYIIPLLTPTDCSMKHFISVLCLLLAMTVSAQNQQQNAQRFNTPQRQGWNLRQNNQQNQMPNRSGQFSPAEYWQQQKSFFTEKANLTEDEANAFFPLYNELQQKKREINREIRRAMMHPENGTEQTEEQSLKAIDAKADANIRIAELEKEYLKKFKEVLPASKILKVQNAEEQFNSQILKDIQQSRGHQFQQTTPQRPGQPQFNQPRPNNR